MLDKTPGASLAADDQVRSALSLSLPTRDDAEAFVATVKETGFDYIRFEMPDMAGLSRGKTVPVAHLAEYLCSGLNIYGGTVAIDTSSNLIPNTGYNEERNYQDCVMVVDRTTLTPVPWLEKTGRVICDTMWYDGRVQMAAPRLVLKKLLAFADSLGYVVKMGHEYEFYVVDSKTRQPILNRQPIFASASNHQIPAVDDLVRVLQAQGIDIITCNVEHGPSQIEINYSALEGMRAADRAFIFKNATKEFLLRSGLLATFMTKPYRGLDGSCSHFHISLLDKQSGLNAFLDTHHEHGLSSVCQSFIQGILDHAPGSMAIWNPTPNCYRRIRPHTFAPSNASWGIQDRTASVRVKASQDQSTHIELRVPSALSNPYLVAAATIATGLLGVMGRSALIPSGSGPKEDDARYTKLPTEMNDALAALQRDSELCEMLGSEFIRAYIAVKQQEIARLRDEIPAAEISEYFDNY